jgi:hypothetical protein
MGEMIGAQLPTMAQCLVDEHHDLGYGLQAEEIIMASVAHVEAYFEGPGPHLNVIEPLAVGDRGIDTNLSCLCPMPLALRYLVDSL